MIAGHLQEKYGFFYIVLSYRDENGKRHTPWFPTKLPVKGNKKRAEALLLEMRQTYQPPELAGKTAAQEQAQPELMFTDFLQQWLEVAKSTIQLTTYASYAGMMRSAILPYFLVRQDIREGELAEFRIKDLALNRKYSVIYHKNKFLPRSARTLMELCKEGNGTDRGL